MRLIDADALIRAMRADPLYFVVEQYNVEGPIHAAPTIDAVPVEWIKKYMSRCLAIEQDAIEEMVKEWAEREE